MQVSAKEMSMVIIGRRSVFLGAETSAYPLILQERGEPMRLDFASCRLLRDADTASIYSIWHLIFSKLSFMPYVHLTHLACLPPEQWMNSSNSSRCRSSSRLSSVAERYRYMARQLVMQPSPGLCAASVSSTRQLVLLPAVFRSAVGCAATATCRRHYRSGTSTCTSTPWGSVRQGNM